MEEILVALGSEAPAMRAPPTLCCREESALGTVSYSMEHSSVFGSRASSIGFDIISGSFKFEIVEVLSSPDAARSSRLLTFLLEQEKTNWQEEEEGTDMDELSAVLFGVLGL